MKDIKITPAHRVTASRRDRTNRRLTLDQEEINLTLAVITERKIDGSHSIQFNNKYFFPVKENGSPVHYRKGTSCLVIQAFDGNLFATINEDVFADSPTRSQIQES